MNDLLGKLVLVLIVYICGSFIYEVFCINNFYLRIYMNFSFLEKFFFIVL